MALWGAFVNSKNFVARRIEEAKLAAKNREVIHSNSEQKGCPTFSIDVARRVLKLVLMDSCGVYNVVNEGFASRLEYVQAICSFIDIPILIHPTSSDCFNRVARVSKNEMALNWRANLDGLEPMPHWKYSLELYIKSKKF